MAGRFTSINFSILRSLERRLPPEKLYAVLKPLVWARAALNTSFKKPGSVAPLPEGLEIGWTRRLARERRMNRYLNDIVEYFQDRLSEPKWRNRCHIAGRERLVQLRQNGRPVVLAIFHTDTLRLLRSWLRAYGFRCATLVAGASEDCPDFIRETNDAPARFYQDDLKAAARFLDAGNVLLIAIDGNHGKYVEPPFCGGWTFRMATGPIRMAIRHEAELIPCLGFEEGPWKYRVEIGEPVPRELLTDSTIPEAASHLIASMRPHIEAHPEQCSPYLLAKLRKCSQIPMPAESFA